MKLIDFTLILSVLCLSIVLIKCDVTKPCSAVVGCKCLISEADISCNLGTTDTTLNISFQEITTKRIVDTFHLTDSTNVTKIPNYFSRNVSFVNINIRNAKSLFAIEENSFWSSVNTTKTFRLTQTSVNTSESLFKAISKLVYLSELVLDDNQFETIPDHAFGEHQDQLSMVSLARNRIRHLGEFAFFNLHALSYLDISENLLNELVNNSLAIKNKDKQLFPVHIRINLKSNRITHISDHALDNLKRATTLEISFNNLTELRPNVFKSIFNFDSSKVIIKGNKVKCDCGINWIYSNKTTKPKFSGPLRCADKRYFADLTDKDFKNCTNYYEIE